MPEVGEKTWIRGVEHRPIDEYSDVPGTEVLATVVDSRIGLVAGRPNRPLTGR